MPSFALLTAAIVACGIAVARIVFRHLGEDPPPVERVVTGAVIGLILWIAANWALALTSLLTRRSLLAVAALFVVGGIASSRRPRFTLPRGWTMVGVVVIALWCGFVAWRATILPPANDDALAYHLPKAVMMMRAHGFARFDAPDFRIRTFPSNYELLLADMLILRGTDHGLGWIATASYLLFLGIVAMMVRSWWGEGAHVMAAVLAAAGAPLLLLHSGHDKNDLLTGALAAAALFWSARWCVRRGSPLAMLAIATGVTAIGTKMSAAAIAVGIAPFGVASLLRKPPRARDLGGVAAFIVAALLLCGGWVFAGNALAHDHATTNATGMPTGGYAHWQHLWKLPYLIVRVSLGFNGRIPWSGETWPWPVENLFSSHYGAVFGLAMLALPICIWRYRRSGDDERDRERVVAGLAAAIAFFFLLPLAQYPDISTPSILRYVMFILPVVFGWTVAPFVRSLAAGRFRGYVPAVMILLIAAVAANALDAAVNDVIAPIEYVRWCAAHPNTRTPFWSSAHAETVVDTMAAPHDEIAIHAGPDPWVYPAYGATLSRPVVFVEDAAHVPPSAKWVVDDQTPSPTKGPTADELRFYEAMRRDPLFVLVYRNDFLNQAVFRRR